MKYLPIVFASLIVIFLAAGAVKLAGYLRTQAISASAPGDASPGDDAPGGDEGSGRQTRTGLRFTNSYLGFSYTIPEDWQLIEINESNFSSGPAETENPEILDLYLFLASFANHEDVRKDNHIGFHISAERISGGVGSTAEYMDYLEDYMLEPDENIYTMIDSGQAVINGVSWETRGFEARNGDASFLYATYTRRVRNDYFLTIMASYWPRNKNALTFIADALSKAMPPENSLQ